MNCTDVHGLSDDYLTPNLRDIGLCCANHCLTHHGHPTSSSWTLGSSADRLARCLAREGWPRISSMYPNARGMRGIPLQSSRLRSPYSVQFSCWRAREDRVSALSPGKPVTGHRPADRQGPVRQWLFFLPGILANSDQMWQKRFSRDALSGFPSCMCPVTQYKWENGRLRCHLVQHRRLNCREVVVQPGVHVYYLTYI